MQGIYTTNRGGGQLVWYSESMLRILLRLRALIDGVFSFKIYHSKAVFRLRSGGDAQIQIENQYSLSRFTINAPPFIIANAYSSPYSNGICTSNKKGKLLFLLDLRNTISLRIREVNGRWWGG